MVHIPLAVLKIYAGPGQQGQGLVSHNVIANPGDQGDRGPQSRGGQGLIGPLSAGVAGQDRACHRFTRRR